MSCDNCGKSFGWLAIFVVAVMAHSCGYSSGRAQAHASVLHARAEVADAMRAVKEAKEQCTHE